LVGHVKRGVRLFPATALIAVLACTAAFAQNAGDALRCEDSGRYRYIKLTPPGPPNRSLRQDNISDEEVREVQRASLEVYPDFIVNISSVTEGCDCEDGATCTAQVWLALYRADQTRSLVLSKVDGHWKIGAVQGWWNRYNAHQAARPLSRNAEWLPWQQENQRLLDSFPACPLAPATWALTRSDRDRATCFDMSSVKVSGAVRRVNVKIVEPSRNEPQGFLRIKYGISPRAYNCIDHTSQSGGIMTYFSDGTALQLGGGENPVRWYPIRPGSKAAEELDLVCSWKDK
jgi:hypothetical protein